MCGIAGVYGTIKSENIMESMLEQLTHRGPDDQGMFSSHEASFAHARLSIIDVDGGRQPIMNEDGSICIIFNGEIYNHKALRGVLAEPHDFRTNSDTEVILHLYEEFGERCVEMLDGMFAFALYDAERGLLLARDPFGIKPLYTSRTDGNLYFASEMKALMGVVDHFDVFPAGTYYQSESGFKRYFTLADIDQEPASAGEVVENVRRLLNRAVQKRLMSDVPLGIFLSGGLDSSIIAAIAVRDIPDLNTFSVGMEDSEDRKYAHLCAEHLGTRHHEEIFTLDDMLEALPEVIYYLESYDAALVRSAIPNYFLARLAAKHVKVVLSGEGADEVFSGYHYLKDLSRDDLHGELVEITEALHNTNLQRCDRMSMAHGLEARVPFLDKDLVRYSLTIPIDLKLGTNDTEKLILRKAFADLLPAEITFRRKSKFSEGAGSCHALANVAEKEISDEEFERSRVLPGGRRLPNKEELMYYRIFARFYPVDSAAKAIGFSRSL